MNDLINKVKENEIKSDGNIFVLVLKNKEGILFQFAPYSI